MSIMENPSRDNITVSFYLTKDLYDQLSQRLPNYGEKTTFFRVVVEKFLKGEIEVVMEKKF